MVATVVVMAFWIDVIETQIVPHAIPKDGSVEEVVFLWIDVVITVFFTLDLAVNIFAHSNDLWKGFCLEPMNWLDVLVVLASIFGVVMAAMALPTRANRGHGHRP